MKIIFLTRFHSHNGQNALGHKLMQAALAHGHELQIINPADVVLEFGGTQGGGFPVQWRGQDYPRADLTLPLTRWDDSHTWQIAETLQSWGHPVSMHQRLPLGDHITMARLLARRNIPAPRSWVLSHPEQLAIIIPELNFPVLMRSRYGGSGRKVAVVQHTGEAFSHAAHLAIGGQPFLVQDLPMPLGEDLRLLVVGNDVKAAVLRQAPAGFVRPKEDGNPRVVPVRITPQETEVALQAARMYGAPFCAVSLLRTPTGPLLLELARVPALGELEQASGQDYATMIVLELVSLAERIAKAQREGPIVPLGGARVAPL